MIKNLWKVLHSKAVLAAALPLLLVAAAVQTAHAQSAEIRAAGVYYVDGTGTGTPNINDVYCNWSSTTITNQGLAAYKSGIVNVAGHQTNDPWDTSALIEYDQPYPDPLHANKYPNHCLALCFDVYCTNKPNGATTYSIAFPLQKIQFEIARYNGSKGIENADTNPAVRVIRESILDNQIVNGGSGTAPSQDLTNYMCGSYTCMGATGDFETTTTCPNPQYECIPSTAPGAGCSGSTYCCRSLTNTSGGYTIGSNGVNTSGNICYCGTTSSTKNGAETPCIVRAYGTGKGYNEPIRFCTAWDGAWEILGEFGKTNGQYGFRANVQTNYPGDNISVSAITVDETFSYPSDNQYPIQVDVTNVHTVRTSTSIVGTMPAVAATPYALKYRLSKDADVKIQIFDASAAIPTTGATGNDGDPYSAANDQGNYTGASSNTANNLVTLVGAPVRHLIDWQPRLGEGMKGSDKDTQITESEQWDGRDDEGRLLPAGNYLASIQAKSQDEWPGTDFSRAVTRQLSIDPLKLTDITVQGLNRQSTAYAMLRYVPTEASNVYFEVYTPGTQFVSDYTRGFEPTGSRPVIQGSTGALVYSTHSERSRGISYPNKWDGLCHMTGGCKITYPVGSVHPLTGAVLTTATEVTFAEGAPLPDGNYVYVLWAEVPYTQPYANGAACYQDSHNAAGCSATITTTGSNGKYTSVVEAGNATGVTCATDGTTTATLTNAQMAICSGVFSGVKTQKYYIGTLPVERGLVDITIQPVSYSTIGSSPTAYGLDPFIFKYSVVREAHVNAYVKNTAGVIVKTLTDFGGNTNVAQQLNTLTWDGRDDRGRYVGPGTYLFVVEAADPMFPNAVKNQASALFPVDLYRLTDLATTDVYGDSAAKATISYMLSKAMNTEIRIYNKDVVIPQQKVSGTASVTVGANNLTPGQVTASLGGTVYTNDVLLPTDSSITRTVGGEKLTWTATNGTTIGSSANITGAIGRDQTVTVGGQNYTLVSSPTETTVVYTHEHGNTVEWTITKNNPTTSTITATVYQGDGKYLVTLSVQGTPWPPRVCNYADDKAFMKQASDGNACTTNSGCYVDPSTQPTCIYVNDIAFTKYPVNGAAAKWNPQEGAAQTLNVRLQPVKTFNREYTTRPGDGVPIMEEWDAQYFYNPTPLSTDNGGKNTPSAVATCELATDLTQCPYEMVPDGTYPFYIAAHTEEPMDIYYDTTTGAPVRTANAVTAQTGLYSTDKNVYRLNITRGPVYFLDGSVSVYPNAPQLFNVSSGPVLVPPYEINFSVSRAATVEVSIVALRPNMCTISSYIRDDQGQAYPDKNWVWNKAGEVCKHLSTMTIPNTANFDPNMVRRIFWDGTDDNGRYVKNGNYEIRLTAKNYPDEGLYQPTVKQYTQSVDLLKVFDLLETDAYNIKKRGEDMHISYQISVPMKVAIQIFKPGTTIYDYSKGTLRDPSTGKEVTNIRDVLVKAIVGFRPSTTLIDEIWDGTDYAQQEVPDGMYPFRFVTALDGADIDSITGEILPGSDAAGSTDYKINHVADTYEYVNLHHATVAIGDGEFVCEDWEKTVFFYPNPLKASTGTMEVTKLPVPGNMSIKIYNLAGDLVRSSGYTCVDAQNMQVQMTQRLHVSPDNNVSTTEYTGAMPKLRNAALRCFWNKDNDHGKKVARGVYFGLVDFRAQNGRQHCQKVVKILVPR